MFSEDVSCQYWAKIRFRDSLLLISKTEVMNDMCTYNLLQLCQILSLYWFDWWLKKTTWHLITIKTSNLNQSQYLASRTEWHKNQVWSWSSCYMISFKNVYIQQYSDRLQVKTTLFCVIWGLSMFYSLVSNGTDYISIQKHLPQKA
jgi:hypothetical protein